MIHLIGIIIALLLWYIIYVTNCCDIKEMFNDVEDTLMLTLTVFVTSAIWYIFIPAFIIFYMLIRIMK